MISQPTPNKSHRCWANDQITFVELVKKLTECYTDTSFKQRWRVNDMLGESGLLLIDSSSSILHGIYLTKQGWQYAGYMKLDNSQKPDYFRSQDTQKSLNFIFTLYAIK